MTNTKPETQLQERVQNGETIKLSLYFMVILIVLWNMFLFLNYAEYFTPSGFQLWMIIQVGSIFPLMTWFWEAQRKIDRRKEIQELKEENQLKYLRTKTKQNDKK